MKPTSSSGAGAVCAGSLLALALLGSGCASIVHGGARTLTINSEPAGATVKITKADTGEAVHTGTTPLTVKLDQKRGFFKGQDFKVSMGLSGHASTDVMVRSELSGWYFGNILFGGVIGMLIVDPATGAMWNLSPDKIQTPLNAQQVSLIKTGEGFVVMLASQVTAAERAEMVRVN